MSQENINKIKKQSLENLIQFKIKKIEVEKYKISKDKSGKFLFGIDFFKGFKSIQKKFKDANLDFTPFLDEIETESKWQNLFIKFTQVRLK